MTEIGQITEEEMLGRIRKGYLIESPAHMTEKYKAALKVILTVSGDTELVSAPAYYMAARSAPTVNSFISAMAIIQDELGHAHIAYRLLQDLGVDVQELVYERDPMQFKYPYAFDVPLETWVELCVANAFYDRAGFILLGDIYKHTSYGPWKRALAKVDKEENFHLRHGEVWMRRINGDAEGHDLLQRAVDWMFPLTVEWFGLPDRLKVHTDQLLYQLKGYTNDQLRQQWLSTAVPLCGELGLKAPAHHDETKGEYELDFPFPSQFDAEEKRWLFEEGEISWDDVVKRWKGRGPRNEMYVERLQKGHKQVKAMLEAA
ncbi:MAG: Phenylacetic acid catabolic protein [Anaerolineae bacterium]